MRVTTDIYIYVYIYIIVYYPYTTSYIYDRYYIYYIYIFIENLISGCIALDGGMHMSRFCIECF